MIWSYVRWFLVMLLYGVVIVSAYIVFPIFYVFRKHLPKTFLYFDVEGIYGNRLWRIEKGLTNGRFKTAWAWCVRRNTAWNYFLWFPATREEPELIKSKYKGTQYNDWRDNLFIPCQIKTDVDNYGEFFDPFKSKLGNLFITYKDKDKFYWNWSIAYRKKSNIFIEWEFGYNDIRPLLNRNRKVLK